MFSCLSRVESLLDLTDNMTGKPDEEFIRRSNIDPVFCVFYSILDQYLPKGVLNSLMPISERSRGLGDIFDNQLDRIKRFKDYLKNGVPTFYNNLLNLKLVGFEVNSFDSLLTLIIVYIYYGSKSREVKTVKQFIASGSAIDINVVLEVPLINILNYDKKFIFPTLALAEKDDPDCYQIAENFTCAVICDWASGTISAMRIIEEIGKMNPDYILHGGDVYNSGTISEHQDNLINPIKHYAPHARVFIVPGNHDLYAGSAGFRTSLKAFGQRASFFSLYNSYLQIDGHDTGFKDSFCFRNVIIPQNTGLVDEEVAWAKQRLDAAKQHQRVKILLTHHMFVSPWNPAGNLDDKSSPVNHDLFDQFKDYLNDIDMCIFGHDHSTAIIEPYSYQGVTINRPRLIGASSLHYREKPIECYETVNINTFEAKTVPVPSVIPAFPSINMSMISPTFMMIKGDSKKVTFTYYEMPIIKLGVFGAPKVFYEESIII